MKRRSFLSMLGIAPVAPILAKGLETFPELAVTPSEPVVAYQEASSDEDEFTGSWSSFCVTAIYSASVKNSL